MANQVAAMLAFGVLVGLAAAFYIDVGVGLWRLQKTTLTMLSVYVLTHQTELIENYSKSYFRALRKANEVALDALSFGRLLKLFLGWPIYQRKVSAALEFLVNAAKLVGDEKTEGLESHLLRFGVPKADKHAKKSKDPYSSGFLV